MNGTLEAIRQERFVRSPSTRPASRVPAGPNLRDSRGAMASRPACTLRGKGSRAVPPPMFRLPLPSGLPLHTRGLCCIGVFSARVLAKLGLRLRLSYHVLQAREQHNSSPVQKIWKAPRPPSGRPLSPPRSPVGEGPSPHLEGVAFRPWQNVFSCRFIKCPIKKKD